MSSGVVMADRLLFVLVRQRVQFHLLDHREQSVGPGGREVLPEPDPVDEIEVRVDDLLRRAAAEHADQQRDDPFGDDRVAVGRKVNFAVAQLGVDPYARLSSPDKELLVSVLLADCRQLAAQFDQVLLFV